MSGLPFHAILVPQGAEYRTVCRGLKFAHSSIPLTVAIPIGPRAVRQFLEQLQLRIHISQPKVLVMGLCGSLKPNLAVGDIVLYEHCLYAANQEILLQHACDVSLTAQLYLALKEKVTLVKALTSDRMIYAAQEKQFLARTTDADVVDMEGFTVVEFLSRAGFAVTTLRVVSDDCHHDLPNLTTAISPEGKLQTLPLALRMIRQPAAATRLIRGSLQGLRVLQDLTTELFIDIG